MLMYQFVIPEAFVMDMFVKPLELPHSRSDWFKSSEEVTLMKVQFEPVVAKSSNVGAMNVMAGSAKARYGQAARRKMKDVTNLCAWDDVDMFLLFFLMSVKDDVIFIDRQSYRSPKYFDGQRIYN